MAPLNLQADESALLKAYHLDTLEPTKWTDVAADGDDIVSPTSPVVGGGGGAWGPEDILGLGSADFDPSSVPRETRASILLTSKSFDPKAYLMHRYPGATWRDLASAMPKLRQSLDARSEQIRILVEENFDRFVAVKSSTSTMSESVTSTFSPETEYRTRALRDHLKQATTKANQVFLPVLEAADSATRLRSTLAVFGRSKYLFNLPSVLGEAIEAGKYDLALRSYRKGRAIRERPPPNLSATEQRILDKVWQAVERTMGELRARMGARLREGNGGVEEIERTIELLLEFDAGEDPVWAYFDHQHRTIMDRLKGTFEKMAERVRVAREALAKSDLSELALAASLKSSVLALPSKNPETIIAKGTGWEVWQADLDLVKALSEVLAGMLPPFWKVARGWMEGRFKRPSSTGSASRRSPTQVQSMSLELTLTYISLLSRFFALSDPSHRSSPPVDPSQSLFLPQGTNSLVAAHYLGLVLAEVGECVGDVLGVEGGGGEVGEGMRGLVESARWRFVEVVGEAWVNDSKLFYHLESWTPSPSPLSVSTPAGNPPPPTTTSYLDRMYAFQQHNTTVLYRLAQPTANSEKLPAPAYVARIKTAFLDSLYSVLDGLVRLASEEEVSVAGLSAVEGEGSRVDVRNPDTRILLTVSNLHHLDQVLIPKMVTQLETAFNTKLDEDRQTLVVVVQELDRTLFDDFVKVKADALTAIIRKGILESGMDWGTIRRPTEVRPYMYEALMYLVQIHSQVTAMARSLLERTLNALVNAVAAEALACFRQVTRFGMGGMLAATLEIEFLHQTVLQYVTPAAAATLGEIYTTISQVYQRAPPAGGSANLQTELDAVKKTLHDSRRHTSVEFACFKQRKEKDKEKEKDDKSRAKETPRKVRRKDSA